MGLQNLAIGGMCLRSKSVRNRFVASFASAMIGLVFCSLSAQQANPLPLEGRGERLAGSSFNSDAGFEVFDWNDDGLPDIYVHDSGSTGRGVIYFNTGTLDKPEFSFGITERFNNTETGPLTIEQTISRAYCDLNGDGLRDVVFYEGLFRYAPNTGTKHGPFLWQLWPERPYHFPGTERMMKENARYATGPESMFWKNGVFARQVLTFTFADWDADGLDDLIVCRFTQEPPGVKPLGVPEIWDGWGRKADRLPNDPGTEKPDPKYLAPLSDAPSRETWWYRNVGTKTAPKFDEGLQILTSAGIPVVAPNPVVFDVDGDGISDLVSTEVLYRCNAFRVDWPTNPNVLWFRRPDSSKPTVVEPPKPLLDIAGKPIPAGTMARFASLTSRPGSDLLVMNGNDSGTIRWYPNQAKSGEKPAYSPNPVVLAANDFPRFCFSIQPYVTDWFAPNSRDLILHGEIDHHCKWGLRRTAIFRNVAGQPGPPQYRFEGWLNHAGNPEMVPVSEEERPYEVYASAIAVDAQPNGKKRLVMSVGGKLFHFTDLAEDGLTFRKMTRIEIPYESNRMKGWQEISVDVPFPVKSIRIGNDRNGMANIRDSFLHVLRFEAIDENGKNVADITTHPNVQVEKINKSENRHYQVDRPTNMLDPGNANTDTELKATTFGFFKEDAQINLEKPSQIRKIRLLLSDRDTFWYTFFAPFYWQGKVIRKGHSPEDIWYHYQVKVSADGTEWTTVSDRSRNEMLYSFPVLLDWNNDGKTDLLLGYSTSNGIYPQTKQYRLYLNSGTNEEPKFSSPIQACDEKGEMLFIRGQWLQNYANQSGFSARDFDGDGRIDLIVEGQTNNELLFLRNVSPNPDGFVFAKPVHVMIGLNRFSYVQSNRFFQIVDIDGDGNLDLVNANGEDIQWFRGISKGAPQPSFAPSEAPVGAVLVATAAATLDAAKPENTSEQPAKILEARATAGGWGQKPKGDQKVFLVRFEGLPAVPVDAATLILCVDRKVQADPSLMVGPFDFQISSNLIDIDWDPATVSWSGPRKDVKWPEKFLDAGGTFQSFAPPALSVGNSTDFRWDITRAVHEAQKRKQTRLDILVRVDYTGHYLDRAGRMFCGPAWQEEGKRPRLILSTKEK